MRNWEFRILHFSFRIVSGFAAVRIEHIGELI
jgi:hypothetical protein